MSLPDLYQKEGMFLYALLDGAQTEEIARKVIELELEQPVMLLFGGTPLEDLLPVSPLLVRVTTPSALAPVLETEQTQNATMLIQSPHDFDTVFDYWQNRLFAAMPYGEEPVIFRLYDPLIFSAFQTTDRGIEKSALFGPCETVWCRDRVSGQWMSYHPEFQVDKDIWSDEALLPLTETHLEVLTDTKISQVRLHLNRHIQQYFPDLCSNAGEAQQFTQALYNKSMAYGFQDSQSMFYFVNIWCYLGSACIDDTQFPEIARLLTQPGAQTPQQRIQTAAHQLGDYPQNRTHCAADYLS
ncbi:hypothetical protein VA7868_04195 [Vibrio aerogenes CECT 7868]|uniref:DUF4123 domain-containing protein n=1 Tax=Vibrio aerogenes CECT 7868 TaxID=1216006 RepID=A0A1M6DD19_9VIBR|nr:DUF4123 domain-containing protein [Vibrio aerogenes]SHI71156.1 hypothetical protein VA7868_04195 [Vibrio aerogenes CECT 7868]